MTRKRQQTDVLESEFKQEMILALCELPGVTVWSQNVGKIPVRDDRGNTVRWFVAGPPVGAGDISGIVDPEGWRIEVELKSPRGKISDAQVRWGKLMRRLGGVHAVVRYDANHDMAWNKANGKRIVFEAITARRNGT